MHTVHKTFIRLKLDLSAFKYRDTSRLHKTSTVLNLASQTSGCGPGQVCRRRKMEKPEGWKDRWKIVLAMD